MQRPAFFNRENENGRLAHWNSGGAPFRLADGEFDTIDMRYARQEFNYYGEHVAERARQALEEQDAGLLFNSVLTLDPGHAGHQLWQQLSDQDWQDLLQLMDTYRQLKRLATETGTPLWS